MPQLSDCIRFVDRDWPNNRTIRILQVKRNGKWVDVPLVKENVDDNSG